MPSRERHAHGMRVAFVKSATTTLSANKSGARCWMQNEERVNLHRRALQALEHSTQKLKVAAQLLKTGNYKEAARLQDEARTERNISVWLLGQAKNLQAARHPPDNGMTRRPWPKDLLHSGS